MLRVIGLISGTSVDGIDVALVEISGSGYDVRVTLQAGMTVPYPAELRQTILDVCGGAALSMAELAELDDAIAQVFAQAALQIQAGRPPADWIGSHGQTVFHRPPTLKLPLSCDRVGAGSMPTGKQSLLGYTLQLGRGDLITHLTGIPTVSNFRTADIAAGGHGAPLVPSVDLALLSHPTKTRCVHNIGGISNLTYLPPRASGSARAETVLGWDTGPGNLLIDLAVQAFSAGRLTYDSDGAWAAQGRPCEKLVQAWLEQPFFHQPPPKSTGREHFGPAYLQECLTDAIPYHLSEADFLATLTDLTAASIALNYRQFLPQLPDQMLVCGGGCKNRYLRQRLQHHLPEVEILRTDDVGVSSDYKEAIAFAVLAYWRLEGTPGNLPGVTGAKMPVLLGEVHR